MCVCVCANLYSDNYANISTVSSLPGQHFRESGQQIGLHLVWSEVSSLHRINQPKFE